MFRGLFYYYATYCLLAVAIAAVTTPLMRMIAFRVGAVDRGEGRRIHDGIVPRLGGGGIFLGVMTPLLVVLLRGARSGASHQIEGIMLSAAIIFALGVRDDLRGSPIWMKLAAQTVAALVVWWWGVRIEQVANPFGAPFNLGWLSVPATVLWVVVITNAINLVDGLDGLATSAGMLIAVTLIILTPASDHLLILSCVVLIGSLAGFLVHNFPPATIFMGDSGSMLVGFMLASLSIVASAKAGAMAAALLPILAFSFPLMDMVYAVLRRYHRGLPLGHADKEHIHHKLLDMGLSKRWALFALSGLNVVVAATAIYFVQRQKNVGFLPLVLFVGLVVVGMRIFGYIKLPAITGDYLRLFVRNRRRRYLSYLLGRVRRHAERAQDLGSLRDALQELATDTGCDYALLNIDLPDVVNPVFSFGAQDMSESYVGIEVPVVVERQKIGSFFIGRRVSAGALAGADEIIDVVSAVVSDYFRRQGSLR